MRLLLFHPVCCVISNSLRLLLRVLHMRRFSRAVNERKARADNAGIMENSVKNEQKVFSNEATSWRQVNNKSTSIKKMLVKSKQQTIVLDTRYATSRKTLFVCNEAETVSRKFRGNSLCLRTFSSIIFSYL